MSKPREFWLRYSYEYETWYCGEEMSFDDDIHVIEKSAADKLAEALEQCRIATYTFLTENVDDNHVTWDLFGMIQEIEGDALKSYREGSGE